MTRIDFKGLGDIAADYDLFLIDQWGVIHNGVFAYEGAKEALTNLRRLGKKVIILSNSAKLASDSYARLEMVGVGRDLYDHVVTSGDTVYQHFQSQTHPFYQALGNSYLCFAWDEGRDIIAQSGKQEVAQAESADFILCSGAAHGNLNAYMPALDIARKRGLPMICANPDLVAVDEKGHIKMCPGTIAKAYEDQGGEVFWHGKPRKEIYDFACALEPDFHRVIGIGDSMEHDICGAANNGLDSVLICGGIHAQALGSPPKKTLIDKLSAHYDTQPTFALPRLVW